MTTPISSGDSRAITSERCFPEAGGARGGSSSIISLTRLHLQFILVFKFHHPFIFESCIATTLPDTTIPTHAQVILSTSRSRVWLMHLSESPRHCVFGVDIAFAVVFGGFLSFGHQRKLLVASLFKRAFQDPAFTPTQPFVAQELAKAESPCKIVSGSWQRDQWTRCTLAISSRKLPTNDCKMGLSVRSDASVASRVVSLWKIPKPWHPTCWWWWCPAIALSKTTAVFQSLRYGGALDVHSTQSAGDNQSMQCLWSSEVLSGGCATCEIGKGHSQPCDQTCTEDSRSSSSPSWYWRAGILQKAAQSLADDAQKCDCLGRHCSYGLSGTKDCSNEAA